MATAISFPPSPNPGDTYTYMSATYTWNGTYWRITSLGTSFVPYSGATLDLNLGSHNLLVNTIGTTGSRVVKLWVTDITVTNAISGNITGNAGTVTGLTLTTNLTNQGGVGVLAWPAAGATLTIPTGGGTLGTAAFTNVGAYEVPLTFSSGLTRTVNAITNDLITGKAGGQNIYGGIAQTESLTLNGNIATASGTNIAGGDVYINAVPGTGTGASTVHIRTGRTLTTGTTLQTLTEAVTVLGNGNVGIGTTAPTARLHLPAGTATISTAPLKFISGTLNTTSEVGAVEFDGSYFYVTI